MILAAGEERNDIQMSLKGALCSLLCN